MGRELFDGNATFRQWMLRFDEQVQKSAGRSVIEVLYSERCKTDQFDSTAITHPAIFMVEYSLAQALIAGGVQPDLDSQFVISASAALLEEIETELRRRELNNQRLPVSFAYQVAERDRAGAECVHVASVAAAATGAFACGRGRRIPPFRHHSHRAHFAERRQRSIDGS